MSYTCVRTLSDTRSHSQAGELRIFQRLSSPTGACVCMKSLQFLVHLGGQEYPPGGGRLEEGGGAGQACIYPGPELASTTETVVKN
jgi:hypothetical protein